LSSLSKWNNQKPWVSGSWESFTKPSRVCLVG
jgi:hypothetical protein